MCAVSGIEKGLATGIRDFEGTYGLAHSRDAPVLGWRARGPALPVLSGGALAAEASTGLNGNYGWPDRARDEEHPSERSMSATPRTRSSPLRPDAPTGHHAGHRRFVTLGHGHIRFWPNVFTPTDSCAAITVRKEASPRPRAHDHAKPIRIAPLGLRGRADVRGCSKGGEV